jgi:hypothetical protein
LTAVFLVAEWSWLVVDSIITDDGKYLISLFRLVSLLFNIRNLNKWKQEVQTLKDQLLTLEKAPEAEIEEDVASEEEEAAEEEAAEEAVVASEVQVEDQVAEETTRIGLPLPSWADSLSTT